MTGTAWAVPGTVVDGDEVVTVARAWPGQQGRVSVEGPDRHGRLRAGTVVRGGGASLLPHGVDRDLPALQAVVEQARDARLLVHRAGRRAVVRHAGGYTKVVRPGRAAAVAAASRTGRELAARAGLAAPQVRDEDGSTVTCSVLPGRPVHELSAEPGWARLWQGWAAAWTTLQGLDPAQRRDAAQGLTRHTDRDEAQVLRAWSARAGGVGVLPRVWAERVEQVARCLEGQEGPARLVPAHRDLHDKQLLWDGAALGVLDLDTACLAAPELDPANLAVHADLRRAQGLWPGPAAAVVAGTAREVAVAAGASADRLAAAELATVVRLACVYAFRPAWREAVLGWAEQRWRASTG